jgi:hypothetical protein
LLKVKDCSGNAWLCPLEARKNAKDAVQEGLDDGMELDVATHTAGDLEAGRKAARAVVMGKVKRTLPSLGAFFTNLSGSEPWTRKIRLLLRNNWLKLKHLQNCCGHPGEPGC